jgi:hypothetical protein
MMAEQLLTVGAFAALTAWRLTRRQDARAPAQHPFAA